MAHSTLAVLTLPEFPQVFPGTMDHYLVRVDRVIAQSHLPNCTHLDQGGYECGDPAVVQFLPDGDQACCGKHLRRKQMLEALEAL